MDLNALARDTDAQAVGANVDDCSEVVDTGRQSVNNTHRLTPVPDPFYRIQIVIQRIQSASLNDRYR